MESPWATTSRTQIPVGSSVSQIAISETSCKRPSPVSDHLSLTSTAVAYGTFHCIRKIKCIVNARNLKRDILVDNCILQHSLVFITETFPQCTWSTYSVILVYTKPVNIHFVALWLATQARDTHWILLVCKTQWTRARASNDQITFIFCHWLFTGLLYTNTMIHLSVGE